MILKPPSEENWLSGFVYMSVFLLRTASFVYFRSKNSLKKLSSGVCLFKDHFVCTFLHARFENRFLLNGFSRLSLSWTFLKSDCVSFHFFLFKSMIFCFASAATMEEPFALAIVFDFTESSIGEQRFCCREQQESRFEVVHGKGFGDAEFSSAALLLSDAGLFFFDAALASTDFSFSERQRQRPHIQLQDESRN